MPLFRVEIELIVLSLVIYLSYLKSLTNLQVFIIVQSIMETIILLIFMSILLISTRKNLLIENLALRRFRLRTQAGTI